MEKKKSATRTLVSEGKGQSFGEQIEVLNMRSRFKFGCEFLLGGKPAEPTL